MKVLIICHLNDENASLVEVFSHDIQTRYNTTIEIMSVDTREGADIAQLYDITQYPAVLAVDEAGKLLNLWQGLPLPLVGEVSYYLQDSFSSHSL